MKNIFLGGKMKKKIFIFSMLALLPLIVSGCSSNITAKYDDFNETFTGKSYYDPMYGRAVIEVKSDKTGALCIGKSSIYVPPMWTFNLTCSDGRAIIGKLMGGKTEGKAITSRNETITFTVAKKQSTINNASKNYTNLINEKPPVDNTNIPIQVIMPN